ncbi:acyltransferase [Hymenobacter aerilatus]|uniref:Acyltransferase n=1 Tax=Hymenobacter aerilatus TaxID=2932251 RepID=A0A8T9SSF3_9BACT|nr:acyltransferase [Hymenobacter aerilatus]UOR03934.1 acyltransferase [Hymenobacter aerilatus]
MLSSTSPIAKYLRQESGVPLSYKELDILHALRGFCAFYVVIYHAKYILWSGGREFLAVFPRTGWSPLDYGAFLFDMLSSAGYEMVIFFFVLSGFFIRYAQSRKYRKLRAFYVNRIVRIYPPYLFASMLAAICLWGVARVAPEALDFANGRELNIKLALAWQELHTFDIIGLIRTLGFMPVREIFIGYNGVYWSLLPEALFYLLVPLAFWRAHFYYAISVFLYASGAVWDLNSVSPLIDYLFIYNFYFAIGAILYDIVTRTAWLTWFGRISGWGLTILVLLLFASLLGLAILKFKILSGLVATILAVISISLMLAGRVRHDNLLVRILHKLGVFSFSLYLYHFPLLFLCYAGLVYFTGETVFYVRYYWLAVPLVTVASYVLYWVSERISVNYSRKA